MTMLVDNLPRQEHPGQETMTKEQLKDRISKMEKLDSIEFWTLEVMLRIHSETGPISDKMFMLQSSKL